MLPIVGLMWGKRHFPREQGELGRGCEPRRNSPHLKNRIFHLRTKARLGAPWLLRQEDRVSLRAEFREFRVPPVVLTPLLQAPATVISLDVKPFVLCEFILNCTQPSEAGIKSSPTTISFWPYGPESHFTNTTLQSEDSGKNDP